MSKALLEIQNLHVRVEEKEILHGVDLAVGQDETHVLMGPNGTGKSTLGYAITGNPAYSVTAGSILFDGEDITALPPHRIARRGIALVPEGRRVFAKMSVYENLLLGATPLEGAHVEENLRRVFSLFPLV
jgi:ABC-type branched-subunit amino acid transport system ATPase component